MLGQFGHEQQWARKLLECQLPVKNPQGDIKL